MLALLLLRPVQAAFDCSGLITNAATGVDEAVAAHECILNGIVQDVVDAAASSARHTAAGGGYNLANVASIWQTFDKKLRLQSCAARSASCRSRLSSRTEVHCRVRPRDGARLGLHRVLRQHERDRRVPDGPDELRRLGVPVARGKHHGFRQGDDVDAKRCKGCDGLFYEEPDGDLRLLVARVRLGLQRFPVPRGRLRVRGAERVDPAWRAQDQSWVRDHCFFAMLSLMV